MKYLNLKAKHHSTGGEMKFYKKDSSNMCEIEDESIHLIITSPPYPMIKKWDKAFGFDDLFGPANFDHQHGMLAKTWLECHRVLVDGGIICINIGDATRSLPDSGFCCFPNYAAVAVIMWEMNFTPLIPIYWKKISNRPNAFLGSGFLPPNGYVSQDHEHIAIFRKGKLRKFKPKDEARYASAFTKEERDLWFQQIWKIQGARGAKETSVFPDEIPYRLIRMFSIIGDTVLDPFCGYGTVMRIAGENHRHGIGYDIVNYIEPITERKRRRYA